MKNVSTLRYPGGKTRSCKKLETINMEHFDFSQFDTLKLLKQLGFIE